jgi:hypothetical protein
MVWNKTSGEDTSITSHRYGISFKLHGKYHMSSATYQNLCKRTMTFMLVLLLALVLRKLKKHHMKCNSVRTVLAITG